jgi:O-antigen ligase
MLEAPSFHILPALREYGGREDRSSLLLLGLIGATVLVLPSLSLLPSLSPYNEKRVLQVGILLVVGAVLVVSRTARQRWLSVFIRLPRLAQWGLCTVLGLGLLSSALAPAPFYAFLEVGHFVLLFAAAGGVAMAVRQAPKRTERFILGAVTVSVLLYAVYFAVRYGGALAFPALEIGKETVGGFANTRFFNQYQTWTLPLLGGAVLALPKRWRAVRGGVLFLAGLWWTLIFASNVRGTVVAMGIAAVGVRLLFRNHAHRWLSVQAMALLGGGVLYFFAFYLIGDAAPQFAAQMQQADGSSWRILRWLSCLQLAGSHPWLGVGPMHFAWPPFHFEPGAHPHNAFLQWLVEWGVPSTVLMSGMIIWGGWQWMQQENEEASTASPRSNAVRVALVASLLAGTAHAMVSGLLVMPVSQILLVLVGGWAWGRFQYRSTTPDTSVSVGAQAAFCVLLIASIGIIGSSLQALKTIKERRSAFLEAVERNKLSPRYWAQGYIGVQDSTVLKRARRDH